MKAKHKFQPMDRITWYKTQRSSGVCLKIPGEVSYYTPKNQVAIKVTNPKGEKTVRFVKEEQIEAQT